MKDASVRYLTYFSSLETTSIRLFAYPKEDLTVGLQAFLSSFAASLAVEARHYGVDICAVHPSPVNSRFLDKADKLDRCASIIVLAPAWSFHATKCRVPAAGLKEAMAADPQNRGRSTAVDSAGLRHAIYLGFKRRIFD